MAKNEPNNLEDVKITPENEQTEPVTEVEPLGLMLPPVPAVAVMV